MGRTPSGCEHWIALSGGGAAARLTLQGPPAACRRALLKKDYSGIPLVAQVATSSGEGLPSLLNQRS